VILLPRELDMVAAGKTMPLPQSKPPIPHEMVAHKGQEDGAHGDRKDRVKLAAKTETEKATVDHAQKPEDHKKSVTNLRQQAQPASNGTTKANSREAIGNAGHGDRAPGHREDRAKPQSEKTHAEKAPIGNPQKTGDHKKSLSNLRQAHPAGKGTANPRS
jgi:hypothetical protein